MDVEEFLASGAFVETREGLHFTQIGKEYVLVIKGVGYDMRAKEVIHIKGKETVVFESVRPSANPPFGLVSELEMILDLEGVTK